MSKAKKIIICFLGACLVVCSCFTASASASNNVYYAPFAQPQINSNSCYLEVVTQSGECYVVYAVASGLTMASSVAPTFKAKIVNVSGFAHLCIYVNPSLMEYQQAGDFYDVCVTGYYYCGANLNELYPLISVTDKSVQAHGYFGGATLRWSGDVVKIHGYNCDVHEVNTNGDFTFVYGADSVINQKIDDIKSGFQSNADKNASDIQSNNDKNTQSIIDNQNQLAEQEKTETQNSGNNSVNDVSGSVPDKSAGMLSALQSLSNAVSYTGTNATWKFPQMYIPAISGVTDRINLNSEMEINFSYWVNQIPQDIRTIISALATIGLVVFAFKELYGLISYVLTLKGGGNNE